MRYLFRTINLYITRTQFYNIAKIKKISSNFDGSLKF